MADHRPTPRQLELLRHIWRYTERAGRPPTIRELCEVMHINSTNGVLDHLQALTKKGLVKRESKCARGATVTDRGLLALGVDVLIEKARRHREEATRLESLVQSVGGVSR